MKEITNSCGNGGCSAPKILKEVHNSCGNGGCAAPSILSEQDKNFVYLSESGDMVWFLNQEVVNELLCHQILLDLLLFSCSVY